MRGPVAALLAASTLAVAACSSDGAPAMPEAWTEVSAADVTFQVPEGWEAQPDDTDGFTAGIWVSPPADDGTRLGISIDVACTAEASEDAAAALDRWLDGPQWRTHEVVARADARVTGAASAARSVSTYVLRREATLEEGEITRHALMAVRDGVAALLLVEGLSEDLPPGLAERVRESTEFGAATPQRVAACEAGRGAGAAQTVGT